MRNCTLMFLSLLSRARVYAHVPEAWVYSHVPESTLMCLSLLSCAWIWTQHDVWPVRACLWWLVPVQALTCLLAHLADVLHPACSSTFCAVGSSHNPRFSISWSAYKLLSLFISVISCVCKLYARTVCRAAWWVDCICGFVCKRLLDLATCICEQSGTFADSLCVMQACLALAVCQQVMMSHSPT